MSLTFRRPSAPALYSFKEKRSEFIAALFPVNTVTEARKTLDSVREKHYQATHNCPAWRLGFPNAEEFSSDDGEPGGTAGRPILAALIAAGLYDAMIIVTRYFGGIKLGVRGLIDAYSAAATGVIERAVIDFAEVFRPVTLCADYPNYPNLLHVLKSAGIGENLCRPTFSENVTLNVLVALDREHDLRTLLATYDCSRMMIQTPLWASDTVTIATGYEAHESISVKV